MNVTCEIGDIAGLVQKQYRRHRRASVDPPDFTHSEGARAMFKHVPTALLCLVEVGSVEKHSGLLRTGKTFGPRYTSTFHRTAVASRSTLHARCKTRQQTQAAVPRGSATASQAQYLVTSALTSLQKGKNASNFRMCRRASGCVSPRLQNRIPKSRPLQ